MSSVGDIFTPTEEHQMLRETVRQFAETEVDPQALEYNSEEKFNRPLFNKLGDLGLLGITAPSEHGGSDMDATAVTIAHEELSAADPAFTLSFLAHSMLFVNNLARNGNEEQLARILPDVCSGAKIGGMGMSEPSAGTDVLAMRSEAKKDGDGYRLTGSKMWITNGCVSDTELGDVFCIYARTAAGSGAGKHSLFLIEKGMEGFSLGQRIKAKCGMRASPTAELVFDNVYIPPENIMGKEGDAVLHMMRNLELERLALAAMSLGIARRCIEVMNSYANERTAFGSPLADFGQIQRHIADSYAEYQAGRAYVYSVASQLNLDAAGNRVDSDGVKLYCAAMAKNVADRAMQSLGGYGYVGEYHVEQLWRDSKLLEIGGGTNEAHQKNMTRDMRRWTKLP